MKIVVLNGSPKGEISVTMQYIKYIRTKFPEHDINILNVARDISKLAGDTGHFNGVMKDVEEADGVIWAFPLYVYLVHSNYKRFIELIHENNAGHIFSRKYACAVSTSINFYDNTAHNYIHAVCDDLDMRYTGFFSARMDDLMDEGKRKLLEKFAAMFFKSIADGVPVAKSYNRLNYYMPVYTPGNPGNQEILGSLPPLPLLPPLSANGMKIMVLTDSYVPGTNLAKMIDTFRDLFTDSIGMVNLSDIPMKSCLGCIHCGFDNICVHDGADEVRNIYEQKLMKADIIIYAGTITDRYLSSKWKNFIDRRFFRTHQRILVGKQVGFLISGPLRDLPNLREIFCAHAELDKAHIVDFVTDEANVADRTNVAYDANVADKTNVACDSALLGRLIRGMAEKALDCAASGYVRPQTFLGIGGMKIFRDDIFGYLRFIFQADYLNYKKTGEFDFPQYDYSTRLFNFLTAPLLRIPKLRKMIQKKTIPVMIRRFRRIFANKARGD